REALREVFGADFSAENDGLHGPMFSILLPPGVSDYLVTVNCAWDVTKRIDIYARPVAVGVRGLAAFCFDPQSGEHVVPPDELPEAPRFAPAAEFQHAMSEFLGEPLVVMSVLQISDAERDFAVKG